MLYIVQNIPTIFNKNRKSINTKSEVKVFFIISAIASHREETSKKYRLTVFEDSRCTIMFQMTEHHFCVFVPEKLNGDILKTTAA